MISSINALTLSPALAAMVLKPSGEPKGILALFDRTIGGMRAGYVAVVRRILRVAIVSVVIVAGLTAGTAFLMGRTSTGFIPLEDNGILFMDLQLPDAAALERTETIAARVAQQVKELDGVRSTVQVSGFSLLNGQAPNAAMIIVDLEPWGQRTAPGLSAAAILAKINAAAAQELGARILAFNPPPIPGLGVSAGVEMEVQQTAGGTPQDLAQAVNSLVYAANQRPEIARSYSSFSANVPQIQLDLDREKAKLLGVAVSDVFLTLQSYLGSFYVNDFNRFGRVYRVMIQAEGEYRDKVNDISQLYVRSASGDMVRLATVVDVKDVLGPSTLTRHNQFRSASVTGVQAPGLSTGDAIRVMEEVAATALPEGYTYQWTGAALQQQGAGGTILAILGLAILFGYLFLVGQYESWSMPMAIILSVLVALFGAIAAVAIAGSDINLYTQIGMIMLVGMASKNGILIVEFAMEARAEGKSIAEAAETAAFQRFRAVMMTALSFLLGVVPLVVASGAGAASQKALGIAVFGGMFAAAPVGVLVVPGLFAVLQWSREFVKGKIGADGGPQELEQTKTTSET